MGRTEADFRKRTFFFFICVHLCDLWAKKALLAMGLARDARRPDASGLKAGLPVSLGDCPQLEHGRFVVG